MSRAGDDDGADVEVEPSTGSTGAGLVDRLLPPVDQLGEDGQPKPSRMDRREQLVAVALGFANLAIAGVAATAIERHQVLALLAGALASAVTVTGARFGNRIVAMLGLFSCVVTRNADTVVFLAFGLPYYAAAMWIFLRYNRLVKAQAILRRQQRAAERGATTATTGARTSAKGAAKKGTSAASTAKGRPPASKRYTPPKPPKKRPPPPPKPPRDRSIVD